MNKGNVKPAGNQLRAFMSQLRALVRSGALTVAAQGYDVDYGSGGCHTDDRRLIETPFQLSSTSKQARGTGPVCIYSRASPCISGKTGWRAPARRSTRRRSNSRRPVAHAAEPRIDRPEGHHKGRRRIALYGRNPPSNATRGGAAEARVPVPSNVTAIIFGPAR